MNQTRCTLYALLLASLVFASGCKDNGGLSIDLGEDFELKVEITSHTSEKTAINTLPVSFTATFSEPVSSSGFSQQSIRNAGTAQGVVWETQDGGDSFSVVIRAVSAESDGTIYPEIVAGTVKDLQGRFTEGAQTPENLRLTLDTEAPQPVSGISFLAPLEANGPRLPVPSWQESIDLGTGIERYEYQIWLAEGDQLVKNWTTFLNTEIFSPLLNIGLSYYLRVRPVDRAGNAGDSVQTESWTLGNKIVSSDSLFNADFGDAFDVEGNRLVVGSPQRDDGSSSQAGAVYFYEYNGKNWLPLEKKISPDSEPNANYGQTVSMSGDFVLVGTPGKGGYGGTPENHGTAYFYRFNGATWEFDQELAPAGLAAHYRFGSKVLVSGNFAFVRSGDSGGHSAVYVYEYDGTDWIEQQKILEPDGVGGGTEAFGSDFDYDNGVLAIGDAYKDDVGTNSGAVYFYRYDGANFVFEEKVFPAAIANNEQFGTSLRLSGATAVISASNGLGSTANSGVVYEYTYDGANWLEGQKIFNPSLEQFDFFGYSLDFDGETLIVGAPFLDRPHDNIGRVFSFKYDGTNWTESDELIGEDSQPGDTFGYSVKISQDNIFIGVPEASGVTVRTGGVYFFEVPE